MPYLIAILLSISLFIVGLAWLTQAQNERIIAQANAQAILINANAHANALLLTASIPMVVVVLAGLAVIILAIGWAMRRDVSQGSSSKHQVIEHRIVITEVLPFDGAQGVPRREVWRQLSEVRSDITQTVHSEHRRRVDLSQDSYVLQKHQK